jgi:hypothetical protein
MKATFLWSSPQSQLSASRVIHIVGHEVRANVAETGPISATARDIVPWRRRFRWQCLCSKSLAARPSSAEVSDQR